MDPWQPCSRGVDSSSVTTTTTDVVDLVESEVHNEEKSVEDKDKNSIEEEEVCITQKEEELSFGDNFQPFVKLPDSQEYLESLERKLKIIQKGGRKGPNADSILRSLGQTKESCMIKLLSNSVEKLTVEGELFEELKVNPILKKLAPEKQALSAEELVHLLKADQLDILLGNNNNDDSTQEEVSGEHQALSSSEITTGEEETSSGSPQQSSSEISESQQ